MNHSVLVSNVFADHNKGGAAITAATIRTVQRAFPGARVTLIAVRGRDDDFSETHRLTLRSHPDVDIVPPLISVPRGPFAGMRAGLRSLLLLALPLRRFHPPELRAIAEADLVAGKGGHVFVERGSLQRSIGLWLTSLPLVLGARLGTPTAVLCTTVGPFRSWHAKAVAGFVLRRVDRVVVRDEHSLDEALRLGIPEGRVVCLPDIAFSHSPPSREACVAMAERFQLREGRFIVLTLCSGHADTAFLPRLREAMLRLLDRGRVDDLVVIPHAAEDPAPSRAFVTSMSHPRIRYLDDDLAPEELMALYGSAGCLVGRRMHSSIFALVAGTPAFPFVKRGMKVQGVMASLGLSDLVLPYPEFDPGALVERIEQALADPAPLRERIRRSVDSARSDLEQLPNIVRGAARVARPSHRTPRPATSMTTARRTQREDVEQFLRSTEFAGYQSVPLPFGFRTPGRCLDRTIAHAIRGRVRGRSVLDAGTNYGLLPYMAIERGARAAVGVEVDPERYRIARRIAELNGGRYSIVHADLRALPFHEPFDVVFCLNVLHHVPDIVAAVTELARHCSDTLVLELVTPRSLPAAAWLPRRWISGSGNGIANRLVRGARRRIVSAVTEGLPLMAVGSDRGAFMTPEAFRNLFVGHLGIFSEVSVTRSLRGPSRWLAVCPVVGAAAP